MKPQRRDILKLMAAGAALAASPTRGQATEAYPSGPVNVIVPYGAGGSTDVLARFLTADVGSRHGNRFFVDSKPGAGGNIGTRLVAIAPPDGATLLYSTATPFAINPFVYKTLPFDPINDFQPIVRLAQLPLVLVVSAKYNIKSLDQLAVYLRKMGRGASFSSYGVGTSSHISGSVLVQKVGAPDVLHVPYKDMRAQADLSEGRNVFQIDAWSTVSPLVTTGKLIPLAVTSTERLPWAPELPTVAEALGTDYEVVTWHAVFAPAKTPRPVIDLLHKEFTLTMSKPVVHDKLQEMGFLRYPPLELDAIPAFIMEDRQRWKGYITTAGIPLV